MVHPSPTSAAANEGAELGDLRALSKSEGLWDHGNVRPSRKAASNDSEPDLLLPQLRAAEKALSMHHKETLELFLSVRQEAMQLTERLRRQGKENDTLKAKLKNLKGGQVSKTVEEQQVDTLEDSVEEDAVLDFVDEDAMTPGTPRSTTTLITPRPPASNERDMPQLFCPGMVDGKPSNGEVGDVLDLRQGSHAQHSQDDESFQMLAVWKRVRKVTTMTSEKGKRQMTRMLHEAP
jgi:hypothetical protein